MREILFRGKDVDRKEWVYGGYSLYPHTRFPCKPTIYEVDAGCWHPVEVIPETVGQYTGLTDENGRKIFEGDIVDVGEHDVMVNGLYRVIFDTVNHCWGLERDPEYHHSYFTFSELNGFAEFSEVVGNAHDNPELLEGGAPDGV